jgi:hypothetical protein
MPGTRPARGISSPLCCLPDLERILGPDHSLTLAVRNNLARWAIVDLFPVKARESVDKSGRAGVVD